MFAITREAYEEFRDYIDALPDSAFRPKPGDRRPQRRIKPIAVSQPSDTSADRKRNKALFSRRKTAGIRRARSSWDEARALMIN